MSFEQHHWTCGTVFGIRYVFHTVGASLPMHKHDAETAHNVIVLRGRALIHYDIGTQFEHAAGDVVAIDWSRPHGIKALEGGTEILNLFLNGQPASYADLPESDKHAVFA